jgi:hypothetical protein
MSTDTKLTDAELAAARQRLAEFRAICAVEGIVFTSEDDELFAMFDRERWSHERCIEYLKAQARQLAAE